MSDFALKQALATEFGRRGWLEKYAKSSDLSDPSTAPYEDSPEFREFASKPIVRTIGKDYPSSFVHGTHKQNIPLLTQPRSVEVAGKKPSKNFMVNMVAPPEQNEFGSELLLSEHRQPHQALIFSQGRGRGLAEVKIRHGTKMLDLSDDAVRAPRIVFEEGQGRYLTFFRRPAITDDMISWYKGKVSERFKASFPDWERRIESRMDPNSKGFDVGSWRENLVRYAKERGYGLVRFADETLVTDRAVLESARLMHPREAAALQGVRTYPPSTRHALFAGGPTGAAKEAWEAQTGTHS
jgi:hypothetical protein